MIGNEPPRVIMHAVDEDGRHKLSTGARLILEKLWRHADYDTPATDEPFVFPSTATLADESGLTDRGVRNALKDLREWGVIAESSREGRFGWTLARSINGQRHSIESTRAKLGRPRRKPGKPGTAMPPRRNTASAVGGTAVPQTYQGTSQRSPPDSAANVVQRAPDAPDGLRPGVAVAAHEAVSKEQAKAWCDRLDEIDRQWDEESLGHERGEPVDEQKCDAFEAEWNELFKKITTHARSLRMWLAREWRRERPETNAGKWSWLKTLHELATAEALANAPIVEAEQPSATVIDFAKARASQQEREELRKMRSAIAEKMETLMAETPSLSVGDALIVAMKMLGIDTKRLGELEVKCR